MKYSRRDLMKSAVVGGAVATIGGCATVTGRVARRSDSLPLPAGPVDPTTRLVGRATFGHRPGDIARVTEMGHAAYVDMLLRADQPADPRLQILLSSLESFELDPEAVEEIAKEQVVAQLEQAAILHAVYGENQLMERMVDLWTDHFNIYALKGDSAFRKPTDDTAVIRSHALGKFPDLLKASAHSPAMLGYLDSNLNRRGVANENYARELMELHTLGVHGGYTQKDVQEVARCLTGWTIEDRYFHEKGTFRFDPERHDDGPKIVLGHLIAPGGGQSDGETVLDILSRHPSTARFVAQKICRYLLGAAADSWVDRTAETYRNTGGDIPSMLRPILLSKEIIEGPPMLKRPLDFVASALRATDSDTDGSGDVRLHLTKMGQAADEWPMPDGYPMRSAAWMGSMLPRWNFAYALARNSMKGTNLGAPSPGGPFEATHGRHEDEEGLSLKAACAHQIPEVALALCLASPSFQWH